MAEKVDPKKIADTAVAVAEEANYIPHKSGVRIGEVDYKKILHDLVGKDSKAAIAAIDVIRGQVNDHKVPCITGDISMNAIRRELGESEVKLDADCDARVAPGSKSARGTGKHH